jgi:predicted MFS family arabinose efflux permease
MKVCLALLVLALVGSTLAPDITTLFALRIVAGAAAGGVIPLALALVGDRVEMARRQVAISRLLIAVITGQLVGSSLAGILAAFIGWRGVFVISAVMMVVAFVATLTGFRNTPRGAAFDLGTALRRYGEILRNPRARLLFGFVFVEAIAVFSIFPYLAPLLEERGQGGSAEAGLALAGFAIGGLVYSALVRWMLATLGLRLMLVAGGIISAAAFLAFGLAGSWQMDTLAMLALGTGFYMLHNSFQTQVTELAPQARASAVALHAFSFFCGQALGVVVFGFGLRAIGLLPSMAISAVAILLVGLAAAATLTRPGQPRAL